MQSHFTNSYWQWQYYSNHTPQVEVEFPTGDNTAAQSNGPSEKIACDAPEDEKDSTESRNFFCPSRTAANVVRVSGAGVAANLAEIVIAGKAWGKSDIRKKELMQSKAI